MTLVKDKQSPPLDWKDRITAVHQWTKNILVLAGAGTGKTTLLIDRLLLLLLGREIPVEKIVALTFTKKAAEEMRIRLEEKLRAVVKNPEEAAFLWDSFPESKTRVQINSQKALENIPKAQIGTIHSFAGHILRLFPVQAGVDPKFREDEGEMRDSNFEREWLFWLAQELGPQAKRKEAWRSLLTQVSLDELKESAREWSSPMVDWSTLDRPCDLKEMAQRGLDLTKKIISSHPQPTRSLVFADSLDSLTSVFKALSEGQSPTPEDMEKMEGPALDRVPVGWEEAKIDLRGLKKRALSLVRVDDSLLQLVIKTLAPFVEHFRNDLKQRGLLSFDDLLVSARNLLRDHPEVREELKKSFDVFLVDEFQDTDPLQGEILFYLAEKFGNKEKEWRKIILDPGRLFVVGDPKQSIYLFRGADMAAFDEFCHLLLDQGALKTQLTTNFRSSTSLLDPVNRLFSSIMLEEPFVQPVYTPLQSGKPGGPSNTVSVVQIKKDPQKKAKASDYRRSEAHFIADWIKARSKEESGLPRFNYRDCALLFRSANAFEEYIEVFKAEGIPYMAEGEKFFYQTLEVTGFLNFLSSIADHRDKLALVGVLRSPFGGCTDQEVLELHKEGTLDYLASPAIHTEKIGRLYSQLERFSNLAQIYPVEWLIEAVFQETWVLEWVQQTRFGEQAHANILKIKFLAQKWSQDNPLTLKDFVARFKKYREDEKEEGENPLSDVNYNAIKLMTIHKAKGLEFPVVFLPNLSAAKANAGTRKTLLRDWRSGKVGLRLPKTGKSNSQMVLLEVEQKRKEEAEEIRIFYVSSTRPKENLFYLVREDQTSSSVFSSLLKAGGILGGETPTGYSVHSVPWKESKPAWSSHPKRELLPPSWDPKKLNLAFSKAQSEWEKYHDRPLFLSPTVEMTTHKKEEDYEKWRVLEEDQEKRDPRAIKIGLVCHRVLEEWDFKMKKVDSKLLRTEVIDYGRLFELIPNNKESLSILKEAGDILESFLQSPKYQFLSTSKIIGKEVPFLYERKNKKDGILMRGIIDLIYEKEGVTIISDYKTNRVSPGGLKEAANSYRIQGDIYKTALQKSRGIKAKFELIFLRTGESIFLD